MIHKRQHVSISPLAGNADPAEKVRNHSSELPALRDQVETLLQAGQPKKTLDLLARSKHHSPWFTNAVAVCLLRLGQAQQAADLFRNLVLSGSLFLRSDVPAAWKVNFAIPLLMTDNLPGCIQVLRDIPEKEHPSVQRLSDAIRRWEKELSLVEKIQWHLGGQPARRVRLDDPPGEL